MMAALTADSARLADVESEAMARLPQGPRTGGGVRTSTSTMAAHLLSLTTDHVYSITWLAVTASQSGSSTTLDLDGQ